MNSSYVDVAAITQVIGCVLNDSSILEDTDKYIIHEDDFVEDFHKIVYGSMYNIHMTGSKVNIDSIIDYLANRPKFEAIFKQNKGNEYLMEAEKNANPDTFNYYYNRLKKFSLLRAYDAYGINVTGLYDPDNILDTKKRQQQEDWLDNTSLIQIAGAIDLKIDEIKSKYIEDDLGLGYQAGDDINELIADLEKHPEVGIPMYGPLINTVTRGARLRKLYIRSAATGVGKAIPNNTLIPTPLGWRKVGDIKPGDYLFGQNGSPTKVLAIYPQPQSKEIWEVTFIDGRKARCCGEHLWEYRYEAHRGHAYRTEATADIYQRTLKLKNGFKNSTGKGYRFAVKLNEAVEYPEKEYHISPYAMGLMLGDGSFRYTEEQKAFLFSSDTDELPNALAQEIGAIAVKNSELNYNWRFKSQAQDRHNLWVKEIFAHYPELLQLTSEQKFIPQEYLQGSIEQRFSLLQGLMDTDGSIDRDKGRTSFTTVSPQLRDNVIELCRSLGMVVTYGTDDRTKKYTTGECYNLHIQCKKNIKPKLFRLKRKVDIATSYANNGKREEHKEVNAIIDIQPLGIYSDMTCFTVEADDHLFLMNDFIVTHNTRSMIADACNFACNMIYHEDFGWIKNGSSQPTLFIATEQDKSEVQTMMLAFLSNVNEEHILNGTYADDEKERVLKAADIIKNSPIWIEELPDFSLQDVENKIKKAIREHDVKYICHDYIQTSLKILEEISKKSGGVKLREDNILFMLAARLKDIANKYGVFILTGTQLNASYQDSETPDQNLLRGAKSIADRCDIGMILLGVTNEDLVKIEPIVASNPNFKMPNIKLSVYKNRRGSYKGVYLWCYAELGTCRIHPQFATNWRGDMQTIEDIKITINEGPGAWN